MTIDAVALGGSIGTKPVRVSGQGWVDIWWHVTRSGVDATAERAMLDGNERARADRFRFGRDRHRYVQRHAFMRRVLSRYLDRPPRDISIHTASHGKPQITDTADLSFSLSSAGALAVLAVSDGRAVGIDIERHRAIKDTLSLARDLFTAVEIDLVRRADAGTQDATFLTLWTRKEALVKAIGGGLSIPLDGFSVLAGDDPTVGRPRVSSGELPFTFTRLQCPPGVIGSFAAADDGVMVQAQGSCGTRV